MLKGDVNHPVTTILYGMLVGVELDPNDKTTPELVGERICESLGFMEGVGQVDCENLGVITVETENK